MTTTRGSGNGRRACALAALVWLVMVLAPATASAHAALTRSDPAAEDSLTNPPNAVTLWFSEPVEAAYTRVTVLDANLQPARAGALAAVPDSSEPALRLPLLDQLPDGAYMVVWSSLSRDDGHAQTGFFSFGVGAAILPSVDEQATVAQAVAAPRLVPAWAAAAARWLGLLGQAVLIGALAFVPLALFPALRAAGVPSAPRARPLRRLLWLALGALTASHLAAAIMQTQDATQTGWPGALGRPLITILTETGYGGRWLARAGLIAALALLAWTLTRWETLPAPRGRMGAVWALALGVGALLLLTTSQESHAAAFGRWSLPVLNDWLHLAGTALWLGGLAAFVVLLPGARAAGATREPDATAGLTAGIVARFSALALGAVGVLVATGLLAARWQVVDWQGLISTRYGAWLLLKLALVTAALGFSARHLLVTRPALASGIGVARAFRRSLRIETTLVILALVATAALTQTSPARLLQRSSRTFSVTRLTPETAVTLQATPGQVGVNEFIVAIAPLDPLNFGVIQSAELRVARRGTTSGQSVPLRPAMVNSQYTFSVTGAFVPDGGDWTLTAVIRRPGVPDLSVPFELSAAGGNLNPAGTSASRATPTGTLALGVVWFVAAFGFGVAGWRFRRQRVSLAYGLFALAVVALVFGSLMLAAGSAAAR